MTDRIYQGSGTPRGAAKRSSNQPKDSMPKPTGKALLNTMQNELDSLRHMVAKRTNKMLLEQAASCDNFEEFKRLTVQVLNNISSPESPLYDRYTNQLSQEAMRLFYNMPATVLCNFDLKNYAVGDLQCDPKANEPLSKKEFLVWLMTQKKSEATRSIVDFYNSSLQEYGYRPLSPDDQVDRMVLSVLDKADRQQWDARDALARILHDENECLLSKKIDVTL